MKRNILAAITALLAIVGISVLLYPQAASWWNQKTQTTITNTYSQEMADIPLPNANLEAAHEYNGLLISGAELEAGQRLPTGSGQTDSTQKFNYNELLKADNYGLMARIRIPTIDVDLPIYHGTSDETLLRGAGHLYGTSLPVGGLDTRTVITAHRGLANATMFTNLDKLQKGDTFTIEVFGERLVYRIFEIETVEPDDRETVLPVAGRDLATLVTCTPLGINSHRILVTGERVFPIPVDVQQQLDKPEQLPGFPWFALIWIGVVLLVVTFLWFTLRSNHKPRHAQP